MTLRDLKPYLVLCAILVVLLSGISLIDRSAAAYAEIQTIGEGNPTFAELSKRFSDLADAKGAVYAFAVLERAKLPANIDLHLLGHVVGDELYKQKGVAGIADCTQDLRNACSHSIVLGALNEFGTGADTLKKIDDACKKAPGGIGAYTMCYHGLGHGVLTYFGFDLSKTVAFCKRTGTAEYGDQQFAQCVGGAIMEIVDGGGHDHEQWVAARQEILKPDSPLSPCLDSVVPDVAKNYCLIYLTPWLMQLAGSDIGHPDPSTFSKAFSYCDAIPSSKQNLRDVCFGGFGKEFVPLAGARDIRSVDQYTDDEYKTAIQWCELAGAEDGKENCIREALGSIFWGGENNPDASFRFCSFVNPPNEQSSCYDELAHNISYYLPNRADLCQKLPSNSQAVCLKQKNS